jgi:hypothetical protein
MATARELLEQVDALMRRNREEANAEIPVLTDTVEVRPPPVAEPVPVLTDSVEVAEPSTKIGVAPETVTPFDSRADDARWELLAEEIRMQVLQRIDIFTDTGLQEQLKARLQPIVDEASARLVATINQQVGQLLRAYVAEAIEREIEKWREGSK